MGSSVVGGASSAAKSLYVQKFTTEGPNTFTLPSGYGASNPLVCEVTLVGGGGGAGGTSYNTTTGEFAWAGGGGGGAVKQEIISLTADATAWVGGGGLGGGGSYSTAKTSIAHSCHGGFGEASWFGTSSTGPANMWINPQFTTTKTSTPNTLDIGIPIMYFVGQNTNSYPPAVQGGVVVKNTTSYNYPSTNAFRVYPSKTYTFSIYARVDSTTVTMGVQNKEYNADGGLITTGTSSTASVTTSWTRLTKTFTPNASTKYVEFYFDCGSGYIYLSNPQLEIGSSATTYKDGTSSGYTSYGSTIGNVTWLATDNVVVANGGGGGAGDDLGYLTSNPTAIKQGFPGASSGGGSVKSVAYSALGGSGGGAGGNAMTSFPTQSGATAPTGIVDRQTPGVVDYGKGTSGIVYYQSNAQYTDGTPGIGINGWGKGGLGAQNVGTFYDGRIIPTTDTQAMSIRNSGHGGDAQYQNYTASATVQGRNGSSGLVIVKYWA